MIRDLDISIPVPRPSRPHADRLPQASESGRIRFYHRRDGRGTVAAGTNRRCPGAGFFAWPTSRDLSTSAPTSSRPLSRAVRCCTRKRLSRFAAYGKNAFPSEPARATIRMSISSRLTHAEGGRTRRQGDAGEQPVSPEGIRARGASGGCPSAARRRVVSHASALGRGGVPRRRARRPREARSRAGEAALAERRGEPAAHGAGRLQERRHARRHRSRRVQRQRHRLRDRHAGRPRRVQPHRRSGGAGPLSRSDPQCPTDVRPTARSRPSFFTAQDADAGQRHRSASTSSLAKRRGAAASPRAARQRRGLPMRRVYLDAIGVPGRRRRSARAFLDSKDSADKRRAQLIDQLLAAPRRVRLASGRSSGPT